MTTLQAVLAAAPTVPAAPPLVDSTVIVAIVGVVGSILLLVVGARLNRKETTASPPAPSGETIGQHDLDVAERLGAIDSKLRRDFERLERLDTGSRDHDERIRAIEHKLGVTPDPTRVTGGNQP